MESKTHAEKIAAKRRTWKRHLKGWQASGLNQAEYCRTHDLKQYHFTYWKKRLAGSRPGNSTFLPVQVIDSEPTAIQHRSASLKLEVSGGFCIQIDDDFNPTTLKKLLAVLESN